jgi:hypothetical protein
MRALPALLALLVVTVLGAAAFLTVSAATARLDHAAIDRAE